MRNIPMSAIWAWRDLRGSWRHFRLVLGCLILSLMAITAVQVTGHSVLRSIAENGQTILGGDWVLRQMYTPVPETVRNFMQQRGATLSDTVEARVMIRAEKNDNSALVELKGVDDVYPLFGTLIADPVNVDLTGGVLLDPMLGERLDVVLGDVVALGETSFTVAGWVAHEPDRAGSGRFGLAPRVLISEADIQKTQLLQPGSMIYHDLRVRFPQGSVLKQLKTDLEEAFPDATWRFTDADNASPQTRRFVNNIVQFLTLVGLSALLIGGIGVANGMRAYMDTRLSTIALFKAIGMTQRTVRAVFIWQIACVGIVGIAIGVLLGALLPVLAAPMLSPLMPFPFMIYVSPAGVLVPILFGLLTVAVFALWPLGQAEKTSASVLFRHALWVARVMPSRGIIAMIGVCVALLAGVIISDARDPYFAAYFVMGACLVFGVFFGMGRLAARGASTIAGTRSMATRLALQNLGRIGNATAQTLVSIGIGLTVLVTIVLIEKNLSATLRDNLPEDAPAFFFLDIQPTQKDAFVALLESWPTARNIIITPNLRGKIVNVNGVPAVDALRDKKESWLLNNDRGFTYVRDMPAHSKLLAGEWWPQTWPPENYDGLPLVSVVDDVQRGFGVKPGDTIDVMILGRPIKAKIANVREVNWTTFTVNFAITFAPGVLEGAPHNWLGTVVADPAQEADLQRAITKAFPNISMVRVSDAVTAIETVLGQMNQAVRVMALLAVLTGMFVLAGALMATRMQRVYDTVILKVLGAPRRILVRALLIEMALLGLLAALTAIGFGTLISWTVLDLFMDLPWALYLVPAFVAALAGWVFIVATGWIVLGRVLRSPAAPYLRNE